MPWLFARERKDALSSARVPLIHINEPRCERRNLPGGAFESS